MRGYRKVSHEYFMNSISYYFQNDRAEITGGIKMNLIPCSEDCLYQSDGCCTLETPAQVTGTLTRGCVHYIAKKTTEQPSVVFDKIKITSEEPQTPHESS